MPGILPMKVIKVGTTSQARIAQACDRCRSKKIRCDGIRPCCSQCAAVGFECKTSDKLSRRAFPRGYTESLEERVRALESEVRELKDLLDEKDEKIDMLSRIHSQSSMPIGQPFARRLSAASIEAARARADEPEPDEVFKVQQSPYLLGEGTDSYFAGTSSARTFVEAFKHAVQASGRSTTNLSTESLLTSGLRKPSDTSDVTQTTVVWKAPPRLLSDQYVNIFFQEWAPLFPILHRPTFLTLYERYVAEPESVTDKAELAQLHLVFANAAVASGTRTSEDLNSFEAQWRASLDAILTDTSMATLQALLLAQLYCIQQGDLTRLLTYKALATSLSARLGLHQSQKRFALGTLTCETRKKVFWALYTIDCFSSVLLGLPKHIKDDDVHCEYPVDADDEYVTERGFQPTLPGECTKLSSALALFKAARILSRVLEEVYPAKTSYDLSLKKLSELSDELDNWHNTLSPHLRLHFAQDKPSTGTISSRSPLLSLTYHYIRALIHRPAICADIGNKASSSMLAVAGSCKHIVQIIQLLEERGLSFTFCLNRDEVLVLSGFGLLFQRLKLEPTSKMLKDNQKSINAIVDLFNKAAAPCAVEFKGVAKTFAPNPEPESATVTPLKAQNMAKPSPSRSLSKTQPQITSQSSRSPTLLRQNSDGPSSAPQSLQASTKKQLKAIASRFTASALPKVPSLDANVPRRATVPDITDHNISLQPHSVQAQSQPSLSPVSVYDPATISRSEPARSPTTLYCRPSSVATRPSATPVPMPSNTKKGSQAPPLPNLDYLSFGGNGVAQAQPQTATIPASQATLAGTKAPTQPTDWEKLLGSLDNGPTNIFDACYGGQPVQVLMDTHEASPPATSKTTLGRSDTSISTSDIADASYAWNADLWALCQTVSNASTDSSTSTCNHNVGEKAGADSHVGQAASVWSMSTGTDDGLCSVDDFSGADWASVSSHGGGDSYKAIFLPDLGSGDDLDYGATVWDGIVDYTT